MNSRDKQNALHNKWLPQAREHFLKSSNQQMSIRTSYKLNVCFVVVVSWDCHSYHRIEFNGMCLV